MEYPPLAGGRAARRGWRRSAGFISSGCPSHATRLAALVGIGRGVDLIIYIWVVISLLMLLNLHLKLRAQMELITVLAREIAMRAPANSTSRWR